MKINNQIKKTEILAPAGTFEALEAAVKAGTDAVYVGGALFSARAFAGNFDREEMLRAIDYCHIYGVRLYMAVNTLLKNGEIERVAGYIEPFYREGVDGIIVQDFGVAHVLAREFPELPLHGSTQMSVSSAYGAQFLKDAGFTRVVPARELSLEEIRSIKSKCDIEIETFIHGAMCYAYSGKCLLSSFIGGRSGNRGRCAQPCRQCYELCSISRENEERKNRGKSTNEYVMSLKDMCTIQRVPELVDAGIDSFKIEGRMKKPEYVAQTVAAYRMAVDMYLEEGATTFAENTRILQAVQDMKDVYNRGGFSSGYYFCRRGPEMLSAKRPNHTGVEVGKVSKVAPPDVWVKLSVSVNPQDVLEIRKDEGSQGIELTSAQGGEAGKELRLKGKEFRNIRPGFSVYRTRNNALLEKIDKEIIEPEKTIAANALVEARVGGRLGISIWNDDCSVTVYGNEISRAEKQPSSPEKIMEKMARTGGSGVRLDVSCNIGEEAFIPMSELNELRRQAIEKFKAELAEKWRR